MDTIFNEASSHQTVNSLKSELRRFYLHCIKWCSQQDRRSSSWANSIFDAAVAIYIGGENRLYSKITNDEIIKIYNLAKKDATKETGLDSRQLINLIDNEPNFDDLKTISNRDYIYQLLVKYCNNSDRRCNIWLEYINNGYQKYKSNLESKGYTI